MKFLSQEFLSNSLLQLFNKGLYSYSYTLLPVKNNLFREKKKNFFGYTMN